MDREKAIEVLWRTDRLGVFDETHEAIEMAISALQTEPKEAISRHAVFNTLDDMDKALDVDRTVENFKALLKECFEKLPSVQPVKTGKWLHRNDDHDDWSECSECGYGDEGEVKFGEETPYCPYCGSRNEREDT